MADSDQQAAGSPNDEGAFVKLFARHERELYAFIFSLVPNWSDADDIMQETCATLWECFADYQPNTSFVAWGCQVAYHRVLRHRRKYMRDKLRFDYDLDAVAENLLAAVDGLEDRRRILAECLQKLDEPDRMLVQVCYSGGQKLKDFAAELGRPVKSVYRRLGKVRRRLFECVQHNLAGEGESS